MRRNAQPKKDGIYSMGEVLITGILMAVLSDLPRATNPRLSLHNSILIYPPSTRAQAEWLQMRFCTLVLQGSACISSRFYLPSGQISNCFSQMGVIWAYLPGSGALTGDPGLGLRPHNSQGEPLQLR